VKSWAVTSLLLVLAFPSDPGAEPSLRAGAVVVRVSAASTTIRAQRAPLARVLEVLASEGGLVVTYDGPPPEQLVTVSTSAPTVEAALGALLTPAHLRYALARDPETRRVRTVVIVNRANPVFPRPARPTPSPTAVTHPDPVATVYEPPLADHPSPPDQ
jgi:hypothetical protein